MVRSYFELAHFDLCAQSRKRLYHDKKSTFVCWVVLFRLIDSSSSVAVRRPLSQIAVVFLLEEDSFQCICKCIGINHIGSVWLREGQHRRPNISNFNISKTSRASGSGYRWKQFIFSICVHYHCVAENFKNIFNEASVHIVCIQKLSKFCAACWKKGGFDFFYISKSSD